MTDEAAPARRESRNHALLAFVGVCIIIPACIRLTGGGSSPWGIDVILLLAGIGVLVSSAASWVRVKRRGTTGA